MSKLPKGLSWTSTKVVTQTPATIPSGELDDTEPTEPVVVSVGKATAPIVEGSTTPTPPKVTTTDPQPKLEQQATYIAPNLGLPVGGKRTPFSFIQKGTPGIRTPEQMRRDIETDKILKARDRMLRARGAEKLDDFSTEADPSELEKSKRIFDAFGTMPGDPVRSLFVPENVSRGLTFAGGYQVTDDEGNVKTVPLSPALLRVGMAKIDAEMSAPVKKIRSLEDKLGDTTQKLSQMDEIKDIPPMIIGFRLTGFKNEKPLNPRQEAIAREYVDERDDGSTFFNMPRFRSDYENLQQQSQKLNEEISIFRESLKGRQAARTRLENQLRVLLGQD
tara:strand:- start:2364 stop:3362 length:999 start_codon:yes stop_codon:yes gene_type:complete